MNMYETYAANCISLAVWYTRKIMRPKYNFHLPGLHSFKLINVMRCIFVSHTFLIHFSKLNITCFIASHIHITIFILLTDKMYLFSQLTDLCNNKQHWKMVVKQFSLRNKFKKMITKKWQVTHWIKCDIFK